MTDDDEPLNPNPIVAAAMRIRARRDLGAAVDSATPMLPHQFEDAHESLAALAANLQSGVKRLNAILGKDGVKFIRLEKPLRIRLRFRDKRLSLDLDEVQQLVKITGLELEGEYQFDTAATLPALMNISKISTDAGYGERLTASSFLKLIAQDAQLPRPAHLDGPGPLSF
ncbi:MAG: hypothetical protein M3Y21_04630 [Candidatus Eremiobacteraeota bacterium]|nr:hypothetical protein [Candidatus Eremiobacteraeota bacterium]